MLTLEPIGYVRGGRAAAEDDDWAKETARIELVAGFSSDALRGLDQFSHAEIIFLFHLVPPSQLECGARHPRGNSDWPLVGIFAQRARARPNRLGVSIARIVKCQGTTLTVAGLDAIDGSPVLDIKPVMREFLPEEEVRQPQWSHELMQRYWR